MEKNRGLKSKATQLGSSRPGAKGIAWYEGINYCGWEGRGEESRGEERRGEER